MNKNREAALMSPLLGIFLTFILFLSTGFVDGNAQTGTDETDTAVTNTETDTASQKPLPFCSGLYG